MSEFAAFALYICVSCLLLVVAPVMMVPAMSMKRKLLISIISFVILVPLALVLYTWLGAPKMAVSS